MIGTIIIVKGVMFYPPRVGERVKIGPIEVGTVTYVQDKLDGCVHVEWDKNIELGTFIAKGDEDGSR